MSTGYYRFPTIHNETVAFVCEDDLWTVSAAGGVARRLTANRGEARGPVISPDGKHIAFVGQDEGHSEIYCMPVEGGSDRRLTYQGSFATVVGWTPDSREIIYAGDSGQPFSKIMMLWKINPDGGFPEKLSYGPARMIAFGPKSAVVIARNMRDSAYWKRYRGGTAGDLWIDPNGKGQFRRLISLKGNLGSPMWLDGRIYFLSDHEGIGNIYSCQANGKDLQRHTHQAEFYVRHPGSDGRRIVYQAGADIYIYDPKKDKDQKVAITFHSSQTQRDRRFVSATSYLEDYSLHPDGHSVAINTRGRVFTMGLWEGAVTQSGERDGVRYRLSRWSSDGKSLITVSDADGEEALEIHPIDKKSLPKRLSQLDIGRPVQMALNPLADRQQVVLSNHRYELIFVDLDKGELKVLDRSKFGRIAGLAWSPDGEWVAYGLPVSSHTSVLKLAKIATGETFSITRPDFYDMSPAFDPEGKYLYFISTRIFNPVYDRIYFDLNFPHGMKPFLITLQKDLKSPFVPEPKAPSKNKPEEDDDAKDGKDDKNGKENKDEKEAAADASAKEDKAAGKEKKDKTKQTQIDLEGIENRVLAFPVEEGIYGGIRGIKGKVLFSVFPAKGSFPDEPHPADDDEPDDGVLMMYDFEDQEDSVVARGITGFKLSRDAKALIYQAGDRLRVWKAGQTIRGEGSKGCNRSSGWLDLSRIRVSVNPPAEWKQMYDEAWRLQRDQFWSEDMSGVDWQTVYKRYAPLLDRVGTRSEMSDVIWEMQGELGTSHCYEMGGDYRRSPHYRIGLLGADLVFDKQAKVWKIAHLVRGDSWLKNEDSPLHAPGLNIKEGDIILAVGGYAADETISPPELLVNLAGQEVTLTLKADNPDGQRTVTVKTLRGEQSARYREWVETNRSYVYEKTKGRVGYVHIPNMGPWGYAEFHRYYLSEFQREGLIVDVRFNGGGHVSQLILQKLAQKRLGYDIERWGTPQPYPAYTVLGPIVALTNELAGSDGDIFSHCFKLLKLGTLIGKRTWGGVVGIHPRHNLVDGTMTTQPEFSFWFKDVAWNVENYGTDPDIDVDITPQDYAAGKDPQMEKALEVILRQMQENPPQVPDFSNRPKLTLPKLPK